jgi:addiction module RelE/StbE family toxin
LTRSVRWSRDALDELKVIGQTIAQDNPTAARNVARKIRAAGSALGVRATGRGGRVTGTYEKSITGIPYILAYTIHGIAGEEAIVILRVIHTARNWRNDSWPQ